MDNYVRSQSVRICRVYTIMHGAALARSEFETI